MLLYSIKIFCKWNILDAFTNKILFVFQLFLEVQFQLYISLHLHQVQSTPINPNDEEQQDFDDEDD